MEGVPGGPGNPRTAFAGLQPLARSLAGCDVRVEDYFACVADQLVDGDGFGFRRLALFQGWSGHFDPVPLAEHGFAGLEAMSGQLPPLDECSTTSSLSLPDGRRRESNPSRAGRPVDPVALSERAAEPR
jgi:hypothetical protein